MKWPRRRFFLRPMGAPALPEKPSTWIAATTSWDFESYFSFIISERLDSDLGVAFLAEALEFFTPLQQDQAALVSQIVDSKSFQLARRIHPIQINVVQRGLGPAVFVNEGEGRAGDVIL